jgi:hypothetical protein
VHRGRPLGLCSKYKRIRLPVSTTLVSSIRSHRQKGFPGKHQLNKAGGPDLNNSINPGATSSTRFFAPRWALSLSLTHQGPWDPTNSVAWCVWTAFATLAVLGNHSSFEDAADRLPGDLLQTPVAHPCGVSTLVKGHAGRFTSRRYHLGVLMGDPAHRSRTVGIRVCELHLQPEEVNLSHR